MIKLNIVSAVVLSMLSVGAFAQSNSGWTIKGYQAFSEQVFKEISAQDDYKKIAEYIYKTYKDAGYPVVDLTVDVKEKTITVSEPKTKTSGKYGKYFKEGVPLQQADIELAILRLKTEANLNGDKVTLDIGKTNDGLIPMNTKTSQMEDYRPYGGSLVFNTMGQRYSGPDVLTGYGYYNIGNGQQLEGSYSHGFQFRPESKGGKFENFGAGYKKAHQYGITSLNYSHTDYKVGGEYADLDLTGKIDSVSLKNEYLFNKNLVGVAGLTYKSNQQRLGIIDISETQTYQFLTLGATYVGSKDKLNYAVGAEFNAGLGGSDKFDKVPLMGAFDPKFTSFKLNLDGAYKFDNGMSWAGKFGLQKGTKETPSAEAFFIGGPDRGRAYTTGFASMPEGMYVSNQLNFKPIQIKEHTIVPYVGHDYASGKMATGDAVTAQSVFVGAQYAPNKKHNFNLVVAKDIGGTEEQKAHLNKVNLVFSMNF